jgi:Txe/YoeB family toxin of Txe-Axe toxin-antitoxin module
MFQLFHKTKEDFIKKFLNERDHQWIKEDQYVKRAIENLLESMTDEHIQFFSKNKTFLIPCQAHLSCAIGKTNNNHLILVFPELIKLLKSGSSTHGMAVLAHEFGHIFHQHTENKIETLVAQIEADQFAFDLGFGEELQEILLDHTSSIDCRVRVAKLTAALITTKGYIKVS